MKLPRLHINLTITLGDDHPDDLTVDLVGTHRDIPQASYDIGFQPQEDRR